jgi:hypothetical protein
VAPAVSEHDGGVMQFWGSKREEAHQTKPQWRQSTESTRCREVGPEVKGGAGVVGEVHVDVWCLQKQSQGSPTTGGGCR